MEQEPTPPETTELPATPTAPPSVSPPPKKSRKKLIIISLIVLLVAGVAAFWLLKPSHDKPTATKKSHAEQSATENPDQVTSLRVDPKKNYGNKYADGLLPVGDSKFSTASASKGTIYSCQNYTNTNGGGAEVRGPWFTNNNTQYDINKKPAVLGSVTWTPKLTIKIENGKRVIVTNDLPDHKTGIFPIGANDPAYQYDRNPNSITDQSLTYSLDAVPKVGDPSCMGGEVGVMITGVALFSAFDAGGRDAGAWEVQDSCSGHPQNKGEYHYHTLSKCITDQSYDKVIGYALDGFPITGPMVGKNNYLTTSDLDECHGITGPLSLDGKRVTMYHYVMTQDFPYSVSCFRGTAIQPPGQHEAQGGPQAQNLQGPPPRP